EFCEHVNSRVHRVTRRVPVEMLAEEHTRLHPIPLTPHTVAFGVTRTVPPSTPMVAFEGGQYSVPARLLGQTVWVRVHGQGADEMIVLVHVGSTGPLEIARHVRATPGSPKINDAPLGTLVAPPALMAYSSSASGTAWPSGGRESAHRERRPIEEAARGHPRAGQHWPSDGCGAAMKGPRPTSQ
ncbi:MAG: hypothetical protein M3Y71_15290, partial [Actinomycetota bacterium]|nr:hypothetical protein [Actinomycetota bacterium]